MAENEQDQERKSNSDLIAMWGLGLFFLLGSLAAFRWGTPSDGYFGLIITCLLLPPIRSFVHCKTGLSFSAGLRTVLCVALFMVGGAVSKLKLHSHKANALTSAPSTSMNESLVRP